MLGLDAAGCPVCQPCQLAPSPPPPPPAAGLVRGASERFHFLAGRTAGERRCQDSFRPSPATRGSIAAPLTRQSLWSPPTALLGV